ncbi:MAG: B12-binding domain-containing radical SAM protein [Candidatus Yonathbacteria bacterium]|nr:B12-binding domain-containing radical SAM protein [Candidatus Yonathbacteria bacterium]
MSILLLVRPNVPSRFQIVPSPGLGYVAQAARIAGWSVTIHDAWLLNQAPLETVNAVFEKHRFVDAIGIQVFYDTVEWTREYIEWARKLFKKAVFFIGGPQVSALPEETRKATGADGIVTGPGELYFGETIPDMPAWDLMDLPAYWPYMQSATIPIRGKRPASIITSRGCHHHCTFCAGHVVHGRMPLLRSVHSVFNEVMYLKDAYGVDELWIHDDNFLYDRDRAHEILIRIWASGIKHIRFPNGIRCENIHDITVKAMKYAGTYMVGIGIESGSPRVLREVKKGLSLETITRAVTLFHQYGIMTSGFFIVGLPPERKEDVADSIRFALGIPLSRIQVGIFNPYPGSEDAGKVSQMDRKTLLRYQRSFFLRFYLRLHIIASLIRHLRWSQIRALFKHPWLKGK